MKKANYYEKFFLQKKEYVKYYDIDLDSVIPKSYLNDLNSERKSDFILSEIKEYHLNTVKTNEILNKKIALVFAAMLAIIYLFLKAETFLFQNCTNISLYEKMILADDVFLVGIAFISVAVTLLIFGYFPKPLDISGNTPKLLITKQILAYELSKIKLIAATSYDPRIFMNQELNKHKANLITGCCIAIVIILLLAAITPFLII